MDSQTIVAALRDTLAELYPEEADTRVVVADAGLDAKRIAFSVRDQTNWQHILNQAIHEQRLDALLEVANKVYGNNPALRAACEQYQRFIEQGNHLTAGGGDFTGRDQNLQNVQINAQGSQGLVYQPSG